MKKLKAILLENSEWQYNDHDKRYKQTQSINEALGSGYPMYSDKEYEYDVPINITISGAANFALGKHEIIMSKPDVQTTIDKIRKFLTNNQSNKPIRITVNGSASYIGSDSGFDNIELAEKRRDAMISILKQLFNDKLEIITGKAIVGSRNSKNFDLDQNISLQIQKLIPNVYMNQGIDNTDTYRPPIYRNGSDGITAGTTRICIQLPMQFLDGFLDYIRIFKQKNKLGGMPWSTTKVKWNPKLEPKKLKNSNI